ncbi:RidA family protein [Microlunatus soli]|uniref:Enamine deaminase RidA, house cleaning of reactive enamine intermediates, YjgF/YER057c/UK114 family n=1 Tax=Microlunatus soli TaxID=630515 RepID=A0A1H1T3A7_9ACTN|nr:RidA family protein [Microlunatus soli]SDS54109.1 Enamine deaminase RidA, house cleaning of reactive enamine intermediates, YjgF/YER057c/UK114 family [Microlunatus soli]
MTASAALTELGLELPQTAAPIGSYQPAVRLGDLIYTSGQLPLVQGDLSTAGKVGADVTIEAATDAARIAGLNAIAAVAQVAGGVDKIERIVKVVVYVASATDFTAQPKVANGASDLFAAVFGDGGVHARSAVGVSVLPLDAPVEVEIIAQVTS